MTKQEEEIAVCVVLGAGVILLWHLCLKLAGG
jgi:hypothetical protein